MSSAVASPGGGNFITGTLPAWAQRGVVGAVAVLVVALIYTTDLSPALMVIGGAILAIAIVTAWSRAVEGVRHATDRFATMTVWSAFLVALTPLISVLWTALEKGSVRLDWAFFNETMRNVIGEGGGAYHAMVGTLVITGVAALAAVPIGILTAVYLNEYGTGRLRRAITFFVDVMTGIPSIVAGLFAYALFAMIFGPGIRLGVMGSIALGVLMVPIVVRSTEEMLRIVPDGLRESAFALGVPKWRVVTKVVLPTATAGIVTGVMLSIARVIGETAPLLVTTGVVASTNWNPFEGRMQNLAVFAYNSYKSPGVPPQPSLDRAWAAALALILLVLLLTAIARMVQRRFGVTTTR